MKPNDLVELINYALKRNDYAIAAELCRDLIQINEELKSLSMSKVKVLAEKIAKLNNMLLVKNKCFMDRNHRMLPYLIDNKLRRKGKQPEFVTNNSVRNLKGLNFGTMGSEWKFTQGCMKTLWPESGSYHNNISICRFLHHNDPYLKLGPFLEERMSQSPHLVVFHDLLNQREIEYLKTEAKPKLSRSRTFDVVGGATNQEEINSGKIRRVVHKTVQAWISEAEWPDLISTGDWLGKNYVKILHPILWKLNKKISLITQLTTDIHGSASSMQVTNYGLAGLCEGHVDPTGIMEHDLKPIKTQRPNLLVHGDIFATLMAWLSDTEAGGGTVFLNHGSERMVLPKKGAAAFWYSLLSDGLRDINTIHAGCPVLKGSKWIMNKWIHMYDNFKKFPCKMKQKSRFLGPTTNHYYT